jgi:transcriptional regulator with XRE-family HTH domain
MDATPYTTFINTREHLGLSQQDIADIAGVDVALVERYEKGELSQDPREHEQLVAHEKIGCALFKIIAQRYPEKVKEAVDPVLELAKTYPEGSVMRNFLNSAGNFSKL